MKNPIQLLTLREVQNQEVRKALESYYEGVLTSSDNYFRYYPDIDNSYFDESFKGIVNDYLLSEGYIIDSSNKYFHILIRWDW